MAGWLVMLVAVPAAGAADLAHLLQQRIALHSEKAAFYCQQERLCGLQVIPVFYARRQYRPAWVEADRAAEILGSLVAAIRDARGDGLRIDDYHLRTLESWLAEFEMARIYGINLHPESLVDLDLLATDAFLLLGSHLFAGRINPETVHADWSAANASLDMAAVLNTAIQQRDVAGVLESLKPPHDGYRELKAAMRRYRQIEASGGWPVLPENVDWRLGAHDARIALLRKRLKLSGDLPAEASDPYPHLFDSDLRQALLQFQARHALEPTGRLDPQTRAALMVPAHLRARQIEINLERWRWLPHDLGRRHIRVNIADFSLQVIEAQKNVLNMRVVVGRDYRRTPVFSDQMRFLVINPYWNIPTKIAVRDILPKVRRDPGYLKRKQIRVFEDWSAGAKEIAPDSIDWNRVDPRHFRYRLRKDPGPQNDLGRIKFMFPNRFAVYLHDTPSRHLFQSEVRSYSSGCVRLEKPVELAEYLLREEPGWNREAIEAAIDSSQRRVIPLPSRVPVHLLYLTAWVDESGAVQFRNDVYGRDKLLDEALEERPPRDHFKSAEAMVDFGPRL
jgi:murein L,D-transpeptidase YcbB/YkuD